MASVRVRRWLVTVLVLVAVASPVLRDRDSFPLSTYPMYAGTRPSEVAFPTVAAYGADRERVRLSLRVIAATDDALIGQTRVRQAIDGGAADALCRDVADRSPDPVRRVEVVTERHDVTDLAVGDESLLGREVHATCEVGG